MPTVDIRNVCKFFGTTEVLHDIDLSIQDREFVILVGPSGCGKSTLLRMVAGLEEISSGEIAIGGRVVNNVRAKDRDIAMVFQNYALYPHMTVYKNMAFSLRLSGMEKGEIEKRVTRAAEILNLSDLLDRQPRQLSGGQRQRVAMGRAIVRDPQVFLFDEPLSNLDAKLRVLMRAEIRDLHQRLAATTIYVTHDQLEAMTMADRIVVMSDGNVEQIGSPLELFDRPQNIFVAGFLGSPSMNFFSGVLRREGGETWVEDKASQKYPLPSDTGGETGQPVIYGIRPEHLELEKSDDSITARLVVNETTGSGTQVVVEADGQRLVAAFNDRHQFQPSETVQLTPQRDHAHLFDAETQRRL